MEFHENTAVVSVFRFTILFSYNLKKLVYVFLLSHCFGQTDRYFNVYFFFVFIYK